MAANILNSPPATPMSVFVVRAFIKMRGLLTDTRELARKLAALEKELTSRLASHESAIFDVLQRIVLLLDPPPPPEAPRKEMGFHATLKSKHSWRQGGFRQVNRAAECSGRARPKLRLKTC